MYNTISANMLLLLIVGLNFPEYVVVHYLFQQNQTEQCF